MTKGKRLLNNFIFADFYNFLIMSSIVSILSKTPDILRELQRVVPNVVFHQIESVERDEQLRKSHVIVADFDLLGPVVYNLPNTKWVQGTWAGLDALMPHINLEALPTFPICRYSGKHFGHLMGEYVVANIVNYERDLFNVKANQEKQLWSTEGKIKNHRTLYDLTIGIMGVGNIGNKIAMFLNYMGAKILGYGRRSTLDLSMYKHITKYYNKDKLPKFLEECDYVVNVLPNTPETKGLLNGEVFKNCQGKAVFINIGRGSIISEESLIDALKKKWISGAILDVFEDEPLKEDSPLWKMSNVFVTPHVAGVSRAKDIAEQFEENYKLFQQSLPIPTTVDFLRGY